MNESEIKLKNLYPLKSAALSCIQCGQCRVPQWPVKAIYDSCPVYKTEFTAKFEPFFSRGKNVILKGLFWGDLTLNKEIRDIFFQCTLCGGCQEFCHNAHNENIEFPNHKWMNQVEVYEALRADLVEAGLSLESHAAMNKALMELLNPYNRNNKEKADWLTQLDFKVKDAQNENAEVLYFVGCTAAFTPQIQKVAIDTAKILKKLGIDFAVFGSNEICCGSVALRTGNREAFNKVAEKNVQLFKEQGIKKIITSCAGCYRTLKKDYQKRLESIEVFHTIEFLDQFIQENKIKLNKLDKTITYHDPCHLGRHMNLYDPPRNILTKISTFVEMRSHHEGAMCCGAGGGVKKGFPELALEISKNRIKGTCPFCYRNLSDGIEALDLDMAMMDLVELILEALE
ncbi:MAG: (Fe-S)-binding protein [Candidatus Helarchaeota archaeon]